MEDFIDNIVLPLFQRAHWCRAGAGHSLMNNPVKTSVKRKPDPWSISSTFYKQLLRTQILKVQKRQSSCQSFLRFWDQAWKTADDDEIDKSFLHKFDYKERKGINHLK